MDRKLAEVPQTGKDGPVRKTVFALGRAARCLARILGNESALDRGNADEPFANVVYRAVSGAAEPNEKRARMVEAMVVASVDHGVTPPSAQATIIAASVRAELDTALASGLCTITDVHGGAGAKAAEFFKQCVARSEKERTTLAEATEAMLTEHMHRGRRVEGMGHRVHTEDPRRNVLWQIADETGSAGPCVAVSKMVSGLFAKVRGMSLPINIDGVIGAVVADMGLPAEAAKALFAYGRTAGLAAHYFEEVATQPPMRRINFAEAVYKGKEARMKAEGRRLKDEG
jgi:citrate synthase